MKHQEIYLYRVGATYRGKSVVFTAEATTGAKAVAEARRQAKAQGMQFITVNYVRPVGQTIIRYGTEYGAPLTALGGHTIPWKRESSTQGKLWVLTKQSYPSTT